MMKRCPGTKTAGAWTGFVCVLDEGHAEKFCQPYVPPTVDEWRGMNSDLDGCLRALSERTQRVRQGLAMLDVRSVQAFSSGYNDGDMAKVTVERDRLALAVCVAKDEAAAIRAENARLQSELDALRAVVERLRPFEAAEMQRRAIAEMMNGGET